MQDLNLPTYSFKLKSNRDQKLIFDSFRKKFVVLTPEEWVRQNFSRFLVSERNVPSGRIVLEKSLIINHLSKRADILIYGEKSPLLLVECKAPEIKIDQKVFDQIIVYNMHFKVNYLILTNGIQHYCCRINKKGSAEFLEDIPDYNEMLL